MQWHNREPTYHENIKHGAPMIFLNYPSKEYIASHLPTKPKSQSPTPYHTAVPTRLEKKKKRSCKFKLPSDTDETDMERRNCPPNEGCFRH